MTVIEHIQKAQGQTLLSYEILPPLKGKDINSIYQHLEKLIAFKPSFINVTYHRSEFMFKKKNDGAFEKIEIRKRPGTVGICAAIMNKYNIDAVPHLICGGFSKQETENALIDLYFLGIHNVFLLRGDAAKNESSFEPEPDGNKYALDLVQQVTNLNQGIYLDLGIKNESKTNFCIGIAGYPEKHFEAPNMESDLKYLQQKINAGAEYITTQMFFDNQHYFSFVEKCKQIGITVPIIPGLKPIVNKKQLTLIPRTFKVDIPESLSKEIMKCKNDDECAIVGGEWLLEQSKELKKAKVPLLHYYTLGKPEIIEKVVKEIF